MEVVRSSDIRRAGLPMPMKPDAWQDIPGRQIIIVNTTRGTLARSLVYTEERNLPSAIEDCLVRLVLLTCSQMFSLVGRVNCPLLWTYIRDAESLR